MRPPLITLVLLLVIPFGIPAARGQAPSSTGRPSVDADPSSRCRTRAPTLDSVLAAYERRSNAKAQQARALGLAKKARRSAWLPQLVLSAEHRQRNDWDRDREIAAALQLRERTGQGQVFRAQMRWHLDRLVHHHASLAALRFARTLVTSHRQERAGVARNYAQWRLIWGQACAGPVSATRFEQAALLRAELVSATGMALPSIAPGRVKPNLSVPPAR